MYADILQRIVLDSPTPAASASALTVLQTLAKTGDFAAGRGLAAALAVALGYDDAAARIGRAASPADILVDREIPAILCLYLVGFSPRIFLDQADRCRAVASGVYVADELYRFQRLVRRDDVLQHEGMKAYLLAAFAVSLDVAVAAKMLPPAGEMSVLDQILTSTKVVAGDGMDSGFSFGREKILALSQEDLLFRLQHELAHHTFEWAMASRGAGFPKAEKQHGADGDRNAPTPADYAELAGALPDLVGGAQKGGQPRPRGTKLASGLSLLMSVVERPAGPYLHMSLTQGGGPVSTASGGNNALLILQLIGADPEKAAAAMSPRGVFHFGVLGHGPDLAELGRRLETLDSTALLRGLPDGSRAWLNRLSADGRFTSNPDEIAVGLGLVPRRPKYYLANEISAEDFGIVGDLRANSSEVLLSHEALKRAVSAAAGAGDNDLLRALLAARGDAIALGSLDIARAGASLGVVDDRAGVKTYFGTTPEGVLTVLETLRDHGGDLNCPLDETGMTLLISAARRSPGVAVALLSLGADPNRGDAKNETPLHAAAQSGQTSLVETLLSVGAAVDAPNRDGVRPLMMAVSLGDASSADVLLSHGANPNAANPFGVTALMTVSTPELAERLIKAGANPNARDSSSATPLMFAARRGLPELVAALLQAGADPDVASAQGDTPLHGVAALPDGAAQERCFDVLLAAGVDVNEETGEGVTPLMVAAHAGRPGALRYLLGRGADVNVRSGTGNTALIFACDPASQWERSFTRFDRMEESIRVLATANAEIDAAGQGGATALHHATHFFDCTIVKCLLELGANANVRTKLGSTPLMSAASELSPAIVDALIAAGADVNARDQSGNTSLFYATRGRPSSDYRTENAESVVKTLLDHGADPNICNLAGDSVANLAACGKFPKAIKACIAKVARATGTAK